MEDKEIMFQLLEVGTMEDVRDYYSKEEMFEDLYWKAPEQFWIGVISEKQAYTIPQIYEKYK